MQLHPSGKRASLPHIGKRLPPARARNTKPTKSQQRTPQPKETPPDDVQSPMEKHKPQVADTQKPRPRPRDQGAFRKKEESQTSKQSKAEKVDAEAAS